jgi:exopolysaccharide biosynthesis protein
MGMVGNPMEMVMKKRFRNRELRSCVVLAVAVLGWLCGGCSLSAEKLQSKCLQKHGIRYWVAVKQQPRPLRIHHLQVDLANRNNDVVALLADDPDGSGSATASLESPLTLARRSRAIAMVNANPWQSLPDAAGKRTTNWQEHMPVETLGLAVSQGQLYNRPTEQNCSFYIDTTGAAHVGTPDNLAEVREGVAGFAQLVREGKLLPDPGGPIHPRTALGLDQSRRQLFLVVVDGRQPGYSEGMSNRELAEYMQSLGCTDAMNLDGGGSSIMILGCVADDPQVVNDPSTKRNNVSVPRPIPVALVVRSSPPRLPNR